MSRKHASLLTSPAFVGADAALQRASIRARELALRSATPYWVMVDGRLVDLANGPEPVARATRKQKGP